MADPYYFVCYSRVDGNDRRAGARRSPCGRPPSISTWLDQRVLQPDIDWDEQVLAALREAVGVLYVMTVDSVTPTSECKQEWTRALKYNKPVIPLLFHRDAEMPFRFESRSLLRVQAGLQETLALDQGLKSPHAETC